MTEEKVTTENTETAAKADETAAKAGGTGEKKRSHNLLRTVIFLCIVLIATIACVQVLGFADAEKSNTVLEEYYALEENTVDCIYFGSSAVQRGFVEPVAYHDHGIAGYSYTCGTQPFVLTKYFMEETLKTQSPRLFLVELRGVCKGPDDLAEVAVRRMLDNMKPSKNRYEAIHYITEYASHGTNEVDTTGMSYYFPFLKYHSRWNPSKQPKNLHLDYYMGYGLDPEWSFKIKKIHPLEYRTTEAPIAPETEEALVDLLDYCDGLDAKVLFVISPYEASELGMEKLNYASGIIHERGYEVLNCLPEEVREEIGLNNDTCYYNREHLNYYGSLKYTHWLSEYVTEHYDLPDRRSDDRGSSWQAWESEYQRLEKNLDTIYSENYGNLMKKVEKRENQAKKEAGDE